MPTIAEQVRTLLESLGDTPDAVAESLAARDIFGLPEDGAHDPISNVLRKEFEDAREEHGAVWDYVDGDWFVSTEYVRVAGGQVPLPPGVKKFVERHDSGSYAYLDETSRAES